MWLLIDDMREGFGCEVIARNSKSAYALLENIQWEGVIFDNDLGPGSDEGHVILDKYLDGLSVYEVAKDIQIVTSNTPALRKMQQALENNGYSSLDGRRFSKR